MEELHLHTGESCTIELPDLSTAGFEWLVEGEYEAIVQVKESVIVKSKTAGGLNTKQYIVTALKNGEANISFKQARPWDKKNSAAKVLHYFVKID